MTRELSFADIMDGIPGSIFSPEGSYLESETLSREISGADVSMVSGTWFDSVSFQGRQAFSITERFRFELESMRQIMDALIKQLAGMSCEQGSFRFGQASDIYIVSMPRSGAAAWEFTQTRAMTYEESEQSRVSAGGVVRTADNKEIDFSFDMTMDRSFIREEYLTETQTGYALLDPLIIQSDMTAPSFSGARFSFDLNLDGETEDLPLPGPGTAFLSLDLNGDGQINDGNELFGPATGDGFGELAYYDLDRNDWIDENDPVFDRLTLWEQAESGGMELTRIKDAGIGAIYLSGVESPFDLTSDENELLGRISKTSIALTEEGEALPVQEMEYKV